MMATAHGFTLKHSLVDSVKFAAEHLGSSAEEHDAQRVAPRKCENVRKGSEANAESIN